jgi:GntR family negative regulator for fad regulon and positive regulator of fabA
MVNDYWREGNLTLLDQIVQHHDAVPDQFILHLLELRKAITPVYIRDAVDVNRVKVIALLANLEQLKDDAACYATFDWELQKNLASLSPNPVYLLILNSFNSFYIKMAQRYFDVVAHRSWTLDYYHLLLAAALNGNPTNAEKIVKETMEKSLVLWSQREEKNLDGGI